MNFFKKITDTERLIKGCLKNNGKCQQQLYDKYKGIMFAICLRYTPDYHSAEDVLQNGFVKVFRNIHKFRGDGSFEGWMRRIFVNTSIEYYRKHHYLYPILEVNGSGFEEISNDVFSRFSTDEILQMIQTLSPGYRIVFNMFVIEGYSHKEISEILNISEGTSKSQLSRARSLLKKKVEALGELEQSNYAKTIGK